jgi:hypothetical protein
MTVPIKHFALMIQSYAKRKANTMCPKRKVNISTAGPSWTSTRDFAREVNHRIYGPFNWERINRFIFGSDSSFPNAAYNYPLYCALRVCLFPLFPYHGNCGITLMRRKKGVKRHFKILFLTCPHFGIHYFK